MLRFLLSIPAMIWQAFRTRVGWFLAKAVFLYLFVLITLRFGLTWMLTEMNAANHIADWTYRTWSEVSLFVTVALLAAYGLTHWVFKR